MGAHHASQVMTERLTDVWIMADLGELTIDSVPQNMIFLGKPLKVLFKSGHEA